MAKKSDTLSVRLGVSEEAYPQLYDFLNETARTAKMDDYYARRMRLVIEEAVGNIIGYSGASEVTLVAALSGNRVAIDITDDGLPFDPTAFPEPDMSVPADERAEGGLGIFYMRQMSDRLAYRRDGDKNILTVMMSFEDEE